MIDSPDFASHDIFFANEKPGLDSVAVERTVFDTPTGVNSESSGMAEF